MVEIRRLTPLGWMPTEPLVAYSNRDHTVISAATSRRGGNSYYDRFGFQGSREIVCIDCKEAGRDVPVILVESTRRRPHFRHEQGEAPDGLGRHGETAEHLRGKALIADWARKQHHILPWSVEEEVWVTGARLRSDVRAELTGGAHVAFEVQRKPLDWNTWDRRHGGYTGAGIHDVWLWSPEVPTPVLDLPLASMVLDMEHEEIGIFVASYSGRYRHPTAEGYLCAPTHYASAPLVEWGISATGALVPPAALGEFIGNKPESARSAQLQAHRERTAGPARQAPAPGPRATPPRQRQQDAAFPSQTPRVVSEREQQRIDETIARIFRR